MPDRSQCFEDAYRDTLAAFHLTPDQAKALRGTQRHAFEHALTNQLIARSGAEFWKASQPKAPKACGCRSSCTSHSRVEVTKGFRRVDSGRFTRKAS